MNKDQINNFREAQEKYYEVKKKRSDLYREAEKLTKDIESFNYKFKNYVDKVLRELPYEYMRIRTSLRYFISADEIRINGLNHNLLISEDLNILYKENSQAITMEEYIYLYNKPIPEPTISISDVLKFISYLKDNYHINVSISREKIKKPKTASECRTFIDINRFYYNGMSKYISEGKKLYVGWDIPDYWVIVENNGIKEVWYSNDAHGGALVNHAVEGTKEYDCFLQWSITSD